MPYRQDILDAVLAIHAAETENGTWATKDGDDLYKAMPPRWNSPGGRLKLHNVVMAFTVSEGNVPTRLAPPEFVNSVKIMLPLVGVEMIVNRTGKDYYENDFSRDIVLPHILAVRTLCIGGEGPLDQAA